MTPGQEWALADEIGKILEIPKHVAKAGLPTLRQHCLVERIQSLDAKAIERAHTLEWYGHRPNQPEANEKAAAKMALREAVKLMLWTLEKINDDVIARAAFEKAIGVNE
jgi:hypothetical protein